jgi:hypothetical protein
LVENEKDDAALEKALREKLVGKVPDGQIGAQIKMISSPWFRNFLQYDPASALSKVTCPVLDINGEKDLQVPPEQNLPPIRKALEAAGNKNFEVDELPGLNHLFQTAKTGGVTEYSQIEETISPLALEKIAGWILKQNAANPSITLGFLWSRPLVPPCRFPVVVGRGTIAGQNDISVLGTQLQGIGRQMRA